MLGKEEEILDLLQKGHPPRSIVEMGYAKSTVYKVYDSFKTFSGAVTKPVWSIENITFSRGNDFRCLPGETVAINFNFRNSADRDFYVVNIGIQAEWMIKDKLWYSQTLNEVVKPGHWRYVSVTFPVPHDLKLAEYELLFGVEGQFLPVRGYDQTLNTEWTDPIILHVKHPKTGKKVFLSHSVQDMHLVRELEKHLDNYGIQVYIGEDDVRPGHDLLNKFRQLIDSSNLFIALLTESAVKSPWVTEEVNYARARNKPMILLKEQSLKVDADVEWISFSKNDPPQMIFEKIMKAMSNVNRTMDNSSMASPLGIALLAFLAGYALKK